MTPEQLKVSILQYAIQGKLVEQRPEEGTAEELYQQIQEEIKELESKKLFKVKDGSPITEEEIPFDIPESWKWVRLGQILNIESGKGLTAKQMIKGDIPVYGGNGVTGYHNEALVYKKTVVIGRVGFYCGSVHVTPDKAWVTDNAFITTYPENNINREYLVYMLRYLNLGQNSNATAQPVVSGKKIYPMLLPLPPLEEQHRIVAKIEELLPYVDRYAAAYEKLEKFNAKFPEGIKKSILQYAIQGKLVEQRPEEGTAEELYQQIQEEKQKLIKEGKIKKEKPLAEITEDEIPFDIPESWKWVRVGNIGSWASGATPSRTNPQFYGGNIPWLKTGDLNDGYIDNVPEHITDLALEKTSVRLNPMGSVLMAMYGATIGKLGLLNTPMTTNQACCACITFKGIFNKYLFYFLMSQRTSYIGMAEGGAQPNISKEKIINSILPLPPLEEQHRIVAKIEELLPYCDQLIK